MFIGAALERNHQFRRLGQLAPAPGVEFSNAMTVEVDFALIAVKAHCEPDLLLTFPALPVPCGVGWKIVGHPVLGVAEQARRADSRLLLESACGRSPEGV